MSEKILSLSDLKTDKRNARKHNPRNIGMIEASLRSVGAARSGVVDEDGIILAGNGTYEALVNAGIEKVRVVETDGNEWVVVQRKGLTEKQKRELALADNRAAELATWSISALENQGIDLKPWFTDKELDREWNKETTREIDEERNEGEEKEEIPERPVGGEPNEPSPYEPSGPGANKKVIGKPPKSSSKSKSK